MLFRYKCLDVYSEFSVWVRKLSKNNSKPVGVTVCHASNHMCERSYICSGGIDLGIFFVHHHQFSPNNPLKANESHKVACPIPTGKQHQMREDTSYPHRNAFLSEVEIKGQSPLNIFTSYSPLSIPAIPHTLLLVSQLVRKPCVTHCLYNLLGLNNRTRLSEKH